MPCMLVKGAAGGGEETVRRGGLGGGGRGVEGRKGWSRSGDKSGETGGERWKTHLLIVLYASWYKAAAAAAAPVTAMLQTNAHGAGRRARGTGHAAPTTGCRASAASLPVSANTTLRCLSAGSGEACLAVPQRGLAQRGAPAPLRPGLGGHVRDISPGRRAEGEGRPGRASN